MRMLVSPAAVVPSSLTPVAAFSGLLERAAGRDIPIGWPNGGASACDCCTCSPPVLVGGLDAIEVGLVGDRSGPFRSARADGLK